MRLRKESRRNYGPSRRMRRRLPSLGSRGVRALHAHGVITDNSHIDPLETQIANLQASRKRVPLAATADRRHIERDPARRDAAAVGGALGQRALARELITGSTAATNCPCGADRTCSTSVEPSRTGTELRLPGSENVLLNRGFDGASRTRTGGLLGAVRTNGAAPERLRLVQAMWIELSSAEFSQFGSTASSTAWRHGTGHGKEVQSDACRHPPFCLASSGLRRCGTQVLQPRHRSRSAAVRSPTGL